MPALRDVFRTVFGRLPPLRALLESRDALRAENKLLEEERDGLAAQRDRLQFERDEQAAHAARLYQESEELLQREQVLLAERELFIPQRLALIAERDQQRQHAERLQREALEAVRLFAQEREDLQNELRTKTRFIWAAPGHFYSPIVNPEDEHVLRAARRESSGVAAVKLDEDRMLALFHQIAGHSAAVPFARRKTDGSRFYFENPAFSFADAITLFGILLSFRPKRIVETGSGFSSCALMDANDRFFGGSIEWTGLDPSPDVLLSLLDASDPYRGRIRKTKLQDAPLSLFTSLQENDIFFVDSSHVAKTGSDVNDYFFRILPALAPGVLVHIHDILYPFEYPEEWIVKETRSWNEAYVLRAFLEYNDAFEVIYWNDLVYGKYADLTRECLPLCLENTGGSIWLKKTTG